jgi:hypothetical protein
MLLIGGLRYASDKGAVKFDVASNLNDGEGVGLFIMLVTVGPLARLC